VSSLTTRLSQKTITDNRQGGGYRKVIEKVSVPKAKSHEINFEKEYAL